MAITYSISDLAREFDLTTRAIRFYEDMGLLSPQRTGSGGRNRVYSARDRTRLKLTLRGKRLGLSLTEAKALIDMYDSPKDTGPQLEKFLQVLSSHRQALESQLAELTANVEEVKAHEKETEASKVREGNQLVFHKLLRILEQKGLKPMDNLTGKPFDAETQEAITQIASPSEEMKGKVIDVIENGYVLGDKVIRFAKVVIGA